MIAHATPAGNMRQPVAVSTGRFSADDYRLPLEANLEEGAQLGRDLARLLLPHEVWALLSESMMLIAPAPDLGLRLRLCLDEDLIDLPWEFLYRPDSDSGSSLGGFLLTDDRISLVREPASVTAVPVPSNRTQRGLFVGAFFDDGSDTWGVKTEHASLVKALEQQKRLITMEFARADEISTVEEQLDKGCDLFHYAGHVELDVEPGCGRSPGRRPHVLEGAGAARDPRKGRALPLDVERRSGACARTRRHANCRVQRLQQRLLAVRTALHERRLAGPYRNSGPGQQHRSARTSPRNSTNPWRSDYRSTRHLRTRVCT